MLTKPIAAAVAGLCLIWGTAQAGNEAAQQPGAAPIEAPEAIGATNGGVVILEVGPAEAGATSQDISAMQMLLLQLLMMQSDGAASPDAFELPPAPGDIAI